jgi:hypothetical protein
MAVVGVDHGVAAPARDEQLTHRTEDAAALRSSRHTPDKYLPRRKGAVMRAWEFRVRQGHNGKDRPQEIGARRAVAGVERHPVRRGQGEWARPPMDVATTQREQEPGGQRRQP